MFTKKRIILVIVVIIILGLAIWLVPNIMKYRSAVQASSGFPYQVGLTKTVLTKCILDPDTGTCPNHDLCLMAPGECAIFTAVDGSPSGGMGSQVLLSDATIGIIGLVSGASYMGGGSSPVLMNVSASIGGISYAVANKVNQAIDFMIALFK